MIFDKLFKKEKELPEFWRNYESYFKNQLLQKKKLDETRFVVLDTETTGLNTNKDRILCIGAIALMGNVIDVGDSFEIYIRQEHFDPESVQIHGLLRKGFIEKVSEKEALQLFVEYVDNAVIVAHHAMFDINMINNTLERNGLPHLKNKIVDTGYLYLMTKSKNNDFFQVNQRTHSLDFLADEMKISKKDRHTASGDAYITAIVFLKLLAILKRQRKNVQVRNLCM